MSKKLETTEERHIRLLETRIKSLEKLFRTTNVGWEAEKLLKQLDNLEFRLRLAKSRQLDPDEYTDEHLETKYEYIPSDEDHDALERAYLGR